MASMHSQVVPPSRWVRENRVGPAPAPEPPTSSSFDPDAAKLRIPKVIEDVRLPPLRKTGVVVCENITETPFSVPSARNPSHGKRVDTDTDESSDTEGGADNDETDGTSEGEGKGKRFLRYQNSWDRRHKDVHASITSSTTGKGSLFAYIQDLSSGLEDIDFTIVDNLLASGADINTTCEITGECIMHHVAANWDMSVADYLLQRGLDIHQKDKEGRTALHVAASTNHTEILGWLIEQGVELEGKTNTERQTPLHLAARNDSVQAMQILIEKGGDCEVRDYKGRTPLHLAAELDRTEAAECLISVPISAEVRVQDDAGNHAIASMIRTMPHVALQALDQLHRVAPAKRKQYFLLNHLEPEHGIESTKGVKTPFEIAVEEKRHTILAHPVMQTLITEKWKFMRWCFLGHLLLYFLFLVSWSLLIAYPNVQEKHTYIFPRDTWRIVLELVAISTYIFQIVEEIFELVYSNLSYRQYSKLRKATLQDDLNNVPPNLVGERKFLEDEISQLSRNTSNYFKDPWNYVDIGTCIIILVVVILHCVDIGAHSVTLALWVARVSCFVLILIWVRLFKFARGFRSLGPLVAIVNQLIGDILRYFTLYAIFFVPYVISVWVLFGGQQSAELSAADREDLTVFYRVITMMFRMSLIDEYPYNSLRQIDEAMTVILVSSFLLFLAVVGLNLFIALLSDTFQRVYDNAQAIALLQQAQLIMSYDEKLCRCFRQYYLKHVHYNCSPKTKFYDDDELINQPSSREVKKITHQIHNIVTELYSSQQKETGVITHDLTGVSNIFADYVAEQDVKIMQITQQLEELKTLLSEKKASNPAAPLDAPAGTDPHTHPPSSSRDHETSGGHHSSPTSPTRQALNELFNHRQQRRIGRGWPASSTRYARQPSLPPLVPGTIKHFYGTQFSTPTATVSGGQDNVSRIPSIAEAQVQQGHRRLKKISVHELREMQWEKKSQPVRRRTPTHITSRDSEQPNSS